MILLGDDDQVEARFSVSRNSANLNARFAPNVPQARKSFWTHLIEHLSDVGLVESHFGLFRDSFSIGAR
jgi:hypothetical protein